MNKNTCRRVLVTGGSRGIGRETVLRFSHMGDRVAFTYKSSAESAKALAEQCGAFPICADSASEPQVREAVKSAELALGGAPNVLVVNAGISESGLLTDFEFY